MNCRMNERVKEREREIEKNSRTQAVVVSFSSSSKMTKEMGSWCNRLRERKDEVPLPYIHLYHNNIRECELVIRWCSPFNENGKMINKKKNKMVSRRSKERKLEGKNTQWKMGWSFVIRPSWHNSNKYNVPSCCSQRNWNWMPANDMPTIWPLN